MLAFFKEPYSRIRATHFLVILILLTNILFFTQNQYSLIVQFILILAVLLHIRDDMKLKRLYEESRSRLREDSDIFDRNVVVSESDMEGYITYVNPKFCEISGYAEEELLGKPHSMFRDPETPTKFYQELWDALKKGETFHGVFKNIKKDGTAFWVDSSISPIKKEFKTVGYKAIRFDISTEILAQQKLEHDIDEKVHELEVQSKRFEFAINSSRDGFWDFDVTKQKFYLSEGWKKRLGFDKDEEMTYLKYLSLIPDDNRFEHHKAMHDMLEEYPKGLENVHFRIRYPLITKNGEKLLIEDVGDAFFDAENQPSRITGYHRDITDQDRQNKMIESQNRLAAMGEMIGNIAHQWRQPIGAINNALNDLEFDIELEDLKEIPSEQYLATSKKVKAYTSHLSQTIDDFKKLSSDEKVKSKFIVKDVMNAAYNVVVSEYDKYKISFVLSHATECNCEFVGYERELLQVFLNILNNAKDVLVEKEIKNPSVVVSLSQGDNEVNINIHDNAGGISDEIIEKIFDPYFTTKHESIGTGIGLYMSKKIILEHFNGSLSAINEGEGAKFCITLPRPI